LSELGWFEKNIPDHKPLLSCAEVTQYLLVLKGGIIQEELVIPAIIVVDLLVYFNFVKQA